MTEQYPNPEIRLFWRYPSTPSSEIRRAIQINMFMAVRLLI
jgi:hypothetical protein